MVYQNGGEGPGGQEQPYGRLKRASVNPILVVVLVSALAFVLAAGLVIVVFLFRKLANTDLRKLREAETEVMGYIDQVQERYSEVDRELGSLPVDGEHFRKYAGITDSFAAELKELEQKAEGVSGLDDPMKQAVQEYFNMQNGSMDAYSRIFNFTGDYLEFYTGFVKNRPFPVDFDTLEEYSEALDEWLKAAETEYEAISYPSCIRSEWEQYGKALAYNRDISEKVRKAVSNDGDILRRISSENMTDRYITVEAARREKILACAKEEIGHGDKQKEAADSLAAALHEYTALGQEEREGYEFEYRTGEITVEYDTVETIYPSLYNTYDAFVIVKTGCISGTRTVVVEAEIPGFTQLYRESFDLGSAYQAIYIKPAPLTGELDLRAAKSAQIRVKLTEPDGTLIEERSFPVDIKSKYDFEWFTTEYGISTKDNILCFLTPESSTITKLKRKAIDEIYAMTDGEMESFVGYQEFRKVGNHYVLTYLQAAGIMRALNEMGVRYNNDTFSLSGSNQHILFPEDVIEQQSGLCVETALTVASALQSAGMHVFLILPPGHVQVAVEAWNSGGGAGKYFLIETTALSSSDNNRELFIHYKNRLQKDNVGPGEPVSFRSRERWSEYLSAPNTYVIDCDDSKLLGLTPFAN